MKVEKAAVLKMFVELGYKGADKWPDNRIGTKIDGLPKLEIDEKDMKGLTEKSKDLLDSILNALEKDDPVQVAAPEASQEDKPKKKPVKDDDDEAPKKKAPVKDEDDGEETVKKKPKDEDEDEAPKKKKLAEDDEAPKKKKLAEDDDAPKKKKPADDEDEAPAKKPSKKDDDEDEPKKKPSAKEEENGEEPKKKGKAPPKSAGGEGKPGVIASIEEFLLGANEDKPISKKKIADKLCERFPDRDRDSMEKTINVQVPNRMAKDKGHNIQSAESESGKKLYWVKK